MGRSSSVLGFGKQKTTKNKQYWRHHGYGPWLDGWHRGPKSEKLPGLFSEGSLYGGGVMLFSQHCTTRWPQLTISMLRMQIMERRHSRTFWSSLKACRIIEAMTVPGFRPSMASDYNRDCFEVSSRTKTRFHRSLMKTVVQSLYLA